MEIEHVKKLLTEQIEGLPKGKFDFDKVSEDDPQFSKYFQYDQFLRNKGIENVSEYASYDNTEHFIKEISNNPVQIKDELRSSYE